MLIRLKVDVSGTRNGLEWPPRGSVIDLPDAEAAEYCASGMAVPVPAVPVEYAVSTVDEETRGPLTTDSTPLVPGPTRRRVARTTVE
jgi:hypothetical protein